MSGIEGIEPVSVLPDRLAAAEFSDAELRAILGRSSGEVPREVSRESFNWIAAYLCEEVGYPEAEVVEWFREDKRSLDWARPLDVWGDEDGPDRLFAYAQEVKEQIDEDLADERPETTMERSHRLGNHALIVARDAFLVAGMDIDPHIGTGEQTRMFGLQSAKHEGLSLRWKGSSYGEDWRITMETEEEVRSYFVVRVFPPGERPFIFQTGIGRHSRTDGKSSEVDTDIDGRPPSIGQVASFVIPLGSEVRNGSLELLTASPLKA